MGILSGKLGKAALGRFALGRRLIQVHARLSQETVEVLRGANANARLSQESTEVIRGSNPNARISQDVIEIVRGVNTASNAGVSQEAIEIIRQHTVGARLSQDTVEVLRRNTIISRLSQHSVEVLRQRNVFGTGPGNGGETFNLQLAPNGTSETATLSAFLSSSDGTLFLTGDSGLPSTGGFVLTIDSEVLFVVKLTTGTYRIFHRGLSNTFPADHIAGVSATWNDTYDMAIESTVDISYVFIDHGTPYSAWLMTFDSSQAYLGSSRYAFAVSSFLGVFPAGNGSSSGNKTDSSEPLAASAPLGVSENCPVGIGTPTRITTDIFAGDVGLARYVNPEASILILGSRSAGIQSWYGLLRVDNSNNDVTLTDPTGNIIDGSVDAEFFDDPFVTTTLPGSSRTFTYGPPRFSDKGWPIGVLAIRQGNRRVPLWTSPDWHNFSYVYDGFGDIDSNFAQVLINRNGVIYGTTPIINLPGSMDITGPNATWDDASYHSSTAFYIAIISAPVLFVGPVIGGPPTGGPIPPTIIPIVGGGSSTSGGGAGPGSTPPVVTTEGGSGGDIDITPPTAAERFWGTII